MSLPAIYCDATARVSDDRAGVIVTLTSDSDAYGMLSGSQFRSGPDDADLTYVTNVYRGRTMKSATVHNPRDYVAARALAMRAMHETEGANFGTVSRRGEDADGRPTLTITVHTD